MFSYTYDTSNGITRASDLTPDAPNEWFDFKGRWGDKAYPTDDERQYELLGMLHYESGPTGPKFKNLERKSICQNEGQECVLRNPSEDGEPRIIREYEREIHQNPESEHTLQ